MTMMTAEDCARSGSTRSSRGRRNIVSGIVNALWMCLLRFLPRRVIVWGDGADDGEA